MPLFVVERYLILQIRHAAKQPACPRKSATAMCAAVCRKEANAFIAAVLKQAADSVGLKRPSYTPAPFFIAAISGYAEDG